MRGTLGELRIASRILGRSPGTSLLAVAALALGIGLTTIMFSILYGALYRGLPFEDAERLFHVERTNPSREIESIAVPIHDYLDWREEQRSFESLAAFYTGTVNVSGGERAERFDGAFITANGFAPLGVEPVLGRLFREGEDRPGAPPVLLLGHDVWTTRYDRDRGVLGRTVRVNGEQATIVGVMPQGFRFPVDQEVWTPLRMDPLALERGEGTLLDVYGKLREGVSREQVLAEFAGIEARLARAHPETNEGFAPLVKPYTEEFIGDEVSRLLWVMMGAVFLVLLVACANVANLLLARASLRTKDVAIRSALGASRLRVVAHLLAEALVLAGAGALLGTALAWAGVEWFARAVADTGPPFWLVFELDGASLLFAASAAGAAAVTAGLVPAFQVTGSNMGEVLKDESRGSSSLRMGRLSRGLVVAEITFSAGLLVASGLMMKGIVNLRTLDYGFPAEELFTARVGLFETDYPDAESRRSVFRELEERLATVPGAEAVALTTAPPGLGSGNVRTQVEGRAYATDNDVPAARRALVTPGFFPALGVDALQGRLIGAEDDADAVPAAVVNRSFVRRFLAGEDPLGRRIRTGRLDTESEWLTVVGVVPDLFMEGVGNPDGDPAGFYVPLAQDDARFVSILIRARGQPLSLTAAVRDQVAAVDPDLPIYFVRTAHDAIRRNTWFYGVFGTLMAAAGFAALFLASVGLFGVMAFSVSRRTQEMGIRMALGAASRDVVRLVMRQGAVQVGLGLLLGLGLAVALARGLRMLFFQVEPWDPAVFVTVAGVLAATGLLACFLPARKATRVDPVVALRPD